MNKLEKEMDKLQNALQHYADVQCSRLELKLLEFVIEWKSLRKKVKGEK